MCFTTTMMAPARSRTSLPSLSSIPLLLMLLLHAHRIEAGGGSASPSSRPSSSVSNNSTGAASSASTAGVFEAISTPLAPGADLKTALPLIPGMPPLEATALEFLRDNFGDLLPPAAFAAEWVALYEMSELELLKVGLTPTLCKQLTGALLTRPANIVPVPSGLQPITVRPPAFALEPVKCHDPPFPSDVNPQDYRAKGAERFSHRWAPTPASTPARRVFDAFMIGAEYELVCSRCG